MSYRQPFAGDYPITQRYGEKDTSAFHTGLDYACPVTTPILASNAGTVMFSGWDKTGYGYTVILLHQDGNATLYAHLAMVACKVGDVIAQSQTIGYSGSTGNSTGPHLHFEARKKWNDFKSHFDPTTLPLMTFIDPLPEPAYTNLRGADAFSDGDVVKVKNPLGVKAFFDKGFSYNRVTTYKQGTSFYYTGESAVRKDNGLTYMRVVPADFSVWVAVNDGETQLLDK